MAVEHESELDFDLNLFKLNLLDSLGALKLVMFLEQETGLSIDLGEVDFDNFRTVRDIHKFVTSAWRSSCS